MSTKYTAPTILKKDDELLRKKSLEVKLPLSKENEDTLEALGLYVLISNNEELTKEHGIRPGVGISAVQIGKPLRMFSINFVDFLDDKNKRYEYNIINPVIVRKSKELIYLPGGEGCLSVDEEVEGLVARHEKITFMANLLDLKTRRMSNKTITLKGYPAIVFQHEYDHLEGILFTDRLNKDIDKAKPLFEIEEDEQNETKS